MAFCKELVSFPRHLGEEDAMHGMRLGHWHETYMTGQLESMMGDLGFDILLKACLDGVPADDIIA